MALFWLKALALILVFLGPKKDFALKKAFRKNGLNFG
jgi:hypothetical protein